MAAEPKRIIFLTGAPELKSLDFQKDRLPNYFNAPVRRFLEEESEDGTTLSTMATPASHPLAKWRAVRVPGWDDEAEAEAKPKTRFRTATFLSFKGGPAHDHGDDREHVDFLEHSLALLQNLDSSHIEVPDATGVDDTTGLTSTSFSTTLTSEMSLVTSNDFHLSSDHLQQQFVNFNGPLTDLKRIPTAQYLQAIYPQTMTVNILASVISVQPTRTVRLRKRPGEMEIIEVLLGDETRAGFNISFWLSPIDSQATNAPTSHTGDALRETVYKICTGDILLVTHIALSEFKWNVYGQSLSRAITRNDTLVAVLSEHVSGLNAPTMAKLNRVRDWSRNFVGKKSRRSPSPSVPDRNGSGTKQRLDLPPDTQFTQP